MAGTNAAILDKGFKDYYKYICDTAEKELREYCADLLEDAIEWRLVNPLAHNFTGNLLNSIVVGLYREKKPVIAFLSSGKVKAALYPKMSKRIKRSYVFRPDYEGEEESRYLPNIKTNKGWGREDATKFFESYTPDGNNLFDIVVAYTVEYAEWVEMERGTVCSFYTWEDAREMGMTFMQLA